MQNEGQKVQCQRGTREAKDVANRRRWRRRQSRWAGRWNFPETLKLFIRSRSRTSVFSSLLCLFFFLLLLLLFLFLLVSFSLSFSSFFCVKTLKKSYLCFILPRRLQCYCHLLYIYLLNRKRMCWFFFFHFFFFVFVRSLGLIRKRWKPLWVFPFFVCEWNIHFCDLSPNLFLFDFVISRCDWAFWFSHSSPFFRIADDRNWYDLDAIQ